MRYNNMMNQDKHQNSPDINESRSLERGSVLISSPLLEDPNFKRTAVLLLDRDASGGHIGLVLNRRLDLTLADICQMPGPADGMSLYNGGPVDLQRMFWLHTLGDSLPGSLEVLPGLYVGGDYDSLVAMFMADKDLTDKVKFYLGYSGWEASQLQKEVESNAWGVLGNILEPHILLELEGDELWHQLCLRLGPGFRHWGIFPSDPNLN